LGFSGLLDCSGKILLLTHPIAFLHFHQNHQASVAFDSDIYLLFLCFFEMMMMMVFPYD